MKQTNKNEYNTPTIICKNHNTLIDSLLDEFIFSVIHESNLSNKEEIINKVKNKTYNDIIYLKGSSIKKEQLKEIYLQTGTTGIEGLNLKFLVIDNIEECSINILNSLLKFIEDPPLGLWILFLTNNIAKVLLTIKSRCIVKQQNYSVCNIQVPDIWKKYSNNLVFAFSTQDELNDFLKTDQSTQILNFINLYEGCYSSNLFLMLQVFKELDYSYILILFKIIQNFNDNKNIFDLINNMYLNPNKTLMFYKLLEGRKINENNMCISNS